MSFLRTKDRRPYKEQLVGASRLVLPKREMVSEEEIERLRLKFVQSQSARDREAFWLAIQHSKQPGRWIEDNEDTWVPPAFLPELPIG
jgi:hypothetical protein